MQTSVKAIFKVLKEQDVRKFWFSMLGVWCPIFVKALKAVYLMQGKLNKV
jgi:hypothetical protein